MRVRLQGYFARYELSAWPDVGEGLDGSRRLRISEIDEARALLRRLLGHDLGQSLRPLLFEIGYLGPTHDREVLVDHIARLIVRGQIVVERHPIEIMASEEAPISAYEFEPPPEHAFVNEFEDEIRVIHWLVAQPRPLIVLDSTPEPPPTIVLDSAPEPPPTIVLDSAPEPPPTIVLDSAPEPPPSMMYGGDIS